jgi:hypothetical protein
MRRLPILALCLLLAAGCAGRRGPVSGVPVPPPAQRCPLCVDPASPKIRQVYAAAVADARVPAPEEISRQLLALVASNDELIRNPRGQILMVTWTKAEYFRDPEVYAKGRAFPLYGDTWMTAAPAMQRFCRALGLDAGMLVLRLEQRLGLPPKAGKDAFLEIWVDPADLFRPCPDPGISDHECQVEVPVAGAGARRRIDAPPWSCDPGLPQVSGKFVTVDPAHLRWMCDTWRSTYGDEDPLKSYPWTALGYTYDWGSPGDPRGESEFVALAGTEVTFHSLTPTELYCAR